MREKATQNSDHTRCESLCTQNSYHTGCESIRQFAHRTVITTSNTLCTTSCCKVTEVSPSSQSHVLVYTVCKYDHHFCVATYSYIHVDRSSGIKKWTELVSPKELSHIHVCMFRHGQAYSISYDDSPRPVALLWMRGQRTGHGRCGQTLRQGPYVHVYIQKVNTHAHKHIYTHKCTMYVCACTYVAMYLLITFCAQLVYTCLHICTT